MPQHDGYEPYLENLPYDTDIVTSVDLTKVTAQSGDTAGVPSPPDPGFLSLQQAYFECEKLSDSGIHVELGATVAIQGPTTTDIPNDMASVFAFLATGDKQGTPATTQWDIKLSTSLYLPYRSRVAPQSNATLDLSMERTNNIWTFHGHADGIDFGALYGYFDTHAKESTMNLLEGIEVPSFDVTYVHGPGDERDLKIQGTFLIKSFELDFNYYYWKALPDSSGTATGTGSVTAPGSGSGSGPTTPTRVPKWYF